MKIITEEMKYRKRLCEYAINYGVTRAARRYHTNRMFVYRQLAKYDGTVKSLAFESRRPHSHPREHKEEELKILKHVNHYYKNDGLAEIYVQAKKRGYNRSYGSMCKIIKKISTTPKPRKKRKSYTKHKEVRGLYPGDKVQVDIKYVPNECIKFDSIDKRYYQITAIDEYSRKRVLVIVDEKSSYHTSKFVKQLEKSFGFKIATIQTDNGSEFVNNQEETKELTLFEKTLETMGIKHKRTRPYSPWQNGKVERSHRLDNERFYKNQEFNSELDIQKKIKRYNARYNNISRKVLEFATPNEMVREYQFNH